MKNLMHMNEITMNVDPMIVSAIDIQLKSDPITIEDLMQAAAAAVDTVYMGNSADQAHDLVQRMADVSIFLASKAIELEAKISAGIQYRSQQTEHVFEAWADEADLEATEPLEDEDEDNYDPDNYWENDLIDWTVEDEEA